MNSCDFVTADAGGETVFFKPDADLSQYDPDKLTRWHFEWKKRDLSDRLRAADAVYDVLDSNGITQVPGSGYPVGAYNAALGIATAVVRCTGFRRDDAATDRPGVETMLALPGDVLERYVSEVSASGGASAEALDGLKKRPPAPDEGASV